MDKYIIIDSTSLLTLEGIVNHNIKKGYTPVGSINIDIKRDVFYQTMVHKSLIEPEKINYKEILDKIYDLDLMGYNAEKIKEYIYRKYNIKLQEKHIPALIEIYDLNLNIKD